ncbi:MAG: ATP-binding protein [candidate division KSB1 bacterium]|nr:ATP-binding protein [candidate division KSB1 bacterium]
MVAGSWIQDCEDLRKQAEAFAAQGNFVAAGNAYDQLSRAWLRGASQAISAEERGRRMANSLKFRELAVQYLSGKKEPAGAAGGAAEPRKGVAAGAGNIRAQLAGDAIGQMLIGLVDSFAQDSNVTWDDIGGLDSLVKDLKRALASAVVRQPEGVKREASGDILLFGPPGTGKTLLAAALSNALCLGGVPGRFYNVRVAGLKGHYQGNTEKSISLLYETAAGTSPSLVFIDEIDGLCTSRSSNADAASRAILGVLLEEMDGMAKKGRDLRSRFVLTVAATNLPWDLDPAILSRFGENRVYVPPPDEGGRRQILEKLILRQGYTLEDPTLLDWLADDKQTKGYSGRDLRSLTAVAKNRMEQEMNPELSEWKDLREIADRTLKLRPLKKKDFESAKKLVAASLTDAVIEHYLRWSDDPTYRPRR